MTELQQEMFRLVLEIDAICRKHEIVYYLAGGSVLGAVRHQGFIPWDDDIDIMMTRQSFNKFRQACEAGAMGDDREIINHVDTPCHTKVTIKYMNKTTSQFFRSQVLDTTGCGISLDIMILDPLPSDKALKEQHIGEYVVYNELLTPFFMVNANLYKYVELYDECQKRAEKIGKQAVMDELYHKLFVAEPEESDQYLYRWGQMLLIYDRDLFGKPRDMLFEGHWLPVPEKTEDFLRATYGDTWIYLPENQDRETHVSNVSATVPYINWLRDIKPFLNREKVLDQFVRRKKLNVKKAVPAHEITMAEGWQKAIFAQLQIESDPDCSYDALKELSHREILKRMGVYLAQQLDAKLMKNGIYIEIPDDIQNLVLLAQIHVGDYGKASKILNLRRQTGHSLTAELEKTEKLIRDIRFCVRYFEEQYIEGGQIVDEQETAEILTAMGTDFPHVLHYHRCNLQWLLEEKHFEQEAALAAMAAAAGDFPGDYEIAFWSGCLYEKMGRAQEAEACYRGAVGTANGIIMMRLKERGTSHD